MKYAIRITETAKSCLKKIIFDLIDVTRDIDLAYNYADRILDHCETLESFPYAGCSPEDEELKNNGFRFLIYGDYLIFYNTDDNAETVYIRVIVNGKKDYASYLRGLLLRGGSDVEIDN